MNMRSIIVAFVLLAPSLALADQYDGSAVNSYNWASTPDWQTLAPSQDFNPYYPYSNPPDGNGIDLDN